MNAKELNFAYRVRHALNENLDSLPESTTARLTSARQMALSRKKSVSPLRSTANVMVARPAGTTGGFLGHSFSWFARMGVAVPLIVAVFGVMSIYHNEKQQRISDIAELDAMLLVDELPLSAYADNGFNAFLARRGE